MTTAIEQQMCELAELRLPELQARFAEIVGEVTRSPNKRWMLRRIAEALQASQAEAACDVPETYNENTDPVADDIDQATDPVEDTAGPDVGEHDDDVHDIKLTKLTIPELQERYRQTLQRETGSTSAAYLQWKIRQAEKGRIRIGPVQRRSGEPGEFKVLPLRMEAGVVTKLDEVRARLGLKSRMELIRQALHAYLEDAGEQVSSPPRRARNRRSPTAERDSAAAIRLREEPAERSEAADLAVLEIAAGRFKCADRVLR